MCSNNLSQDDNGKFITHFSSNGSQKLLVNMKFYLTGFAKLKRLFLGVQPQGEVFERVIDLDFERFGAGFNDF